MRFSVDRPIAPKNALLCMAACACLWSTSGALIKLISWNGMAIAGMRSLIAGVVLLAYLKLAGKKLVVNRLTLTVGFAVMLKFVCFTVGNKLTSSANMVALQYTNPVFVLIFSMLFFGQRFRRKDIAVALATAGGIAMLTLEGTGSSTMLGNFLGLMVGITTAIMHLMSGKAKSYAESLSINIFGNIYTAVLMCPFFFTGGGLSWDAGSVTGILLLGLFQQAAAYIFYGFAIRNAPTLNCTLIAALNPLFNPVWTALLVHEYPGPLTLAGFGIVLVSITLWTLSNARDKTAEQAKTPRGE